MEEGRIEMVLARITELRSKITNCIAADRTEGGELRKGGTEMDSEEAAADEDGDDEVSDCLLGIRDALEKLEVQVSSLQALHEQQLYEKAEAFAGIAYSQEKLLKKLTEYRGGDNLDIINEAIAFVGETVEENNDLLLPPYPSLPYSLASDKLYPSYSPSSHVISQKGGIHGSQPHELTKDLHGSHQEEAKRPSRMVTCFIGVAARAALTVVGLISVLTLAGFEPRLKKRDNCLKVTNLFQLFGIDKKGRNAKCPPGKVLVFENGETRCVVRERVEIPFHSGVATPDVNYGCG